MAQNRRATPPSDAMCGTCNAEFKSPALQCQNCNIYYHPACAEMPLYYMVRYARSTIKFQCKQCTENSIGSHWADTAHLVRDCYANITYMESPHDQNDTDVPAEGSRTESHTQNKEETPNEQAEERRKQINENEHET